MCLSEAKGMDIPIKFTLQPEDKLELEKLVKSGMTPVVISRRAQILLKKAQNKSSTVVADEIGVNRHTVELWCQKYRNRGANQTIRTAFISNGISF